MGIIGRDAVGTLAAEVHDAFLGIKARESELCHGSTTGAQILTEAGNISEGQLELQRPEANKKRRLVPALIRLPLGLPVDWPRVTMRTWQTNRIALPCPISGL